MYKEKKVAVVIPVYNEESLILKVLQTIPGFVDSILVVDDKSTDSSKNIVEQYISSAKKNILLIEHSVNKGVGAAIISGYRKAIEMNLDIAAVMAGDGQMDPGDLPALLQPLIHGGVDYVKGNRLFTGEVWHIMPKIRYLGNSLLSLFTKIASGYWHIADSQTGYTAISLQCLQKMHRANLLDRIYPRYGMPNDMLVRLNVINARVVDVPITPVYNIGEQSGIRLRKVIPTLSFLLLRRFFWRMKEKYIIRDFHPLIFFYGIAFILITVDIPLIYRAFFIGVTTGNIPPINMLTVTFITIMAVQFLLFAMWFDMESNKDLK
ncbi:glycosyltransferase family 2 protein [Candidatus Omnitrophota bacterium]